MQSPLRYPGGKAKLFRFFSNLISQNDLYKKIYAEPYAGGAGLALRLLGHGFVEKIELNDIDPAVYAFWHSALNETEQLCRLISTAKLDVEEWRNQRKIYREGSSASLLELGFAALFLNRTSRSGIIEGSGPIGGYEQLGLWKIDARFRAAKLIAAIEEIGKFSTHIQVTNLDAVDFISPRLSSGNHFCYLDPPYYVKGRKLYKNFYSHADHASIASLLMQHRRGCWILSYDNVDQVRELYGALTPLIYSLQYSAGPNTSGQEVIYGSDNLKLPAAVEVSNAA